MALYKYIKQPRMRRKCETATCLNMFYFLSHYTSARVHSVMQLVRKAMQRDTSVQKWWLLNRLVYKLHGRVTALKGGGGGGGGG